MKFENCITTFPRHIQTQNPITHSPKKIIQDIKSTCTFLNNNPEILIIKADKGNTTVSMCRNDYYNKLQLLLSDNSTYTPLKRDPTLTIQKKVNNLTKIWKKKNYIDDNLVESLTSHNSSPARLYVLPKIHKPTFPLRPIVSFCGSPTYNLASFYNRTISNNITPPISREKIVLNLFKKFYCHNPPGHKIISLDAVSLFTNVQIGIAIKSIKDR